MFSTVSIQRIVISISLFKRVAKEYPDVICMKQNDADASYESLPDLVKHMISDQMTFDQFKQADRAFDGIIPLLYRLKGKL